jgi:hypothetical protein
MQFTAPAGKLHKTIEEVCLLMLVGVMIIQFQESTSHSASLWTTVIEANCGIRR